MNYRFLFSLFLSLLFYSNSYAQNNKNGIETDIEIAPQYIGGVDSMNSFLSKNIIYPPFDISKGVSGVVILKFGVDTSGSIIDISIVKSVSYGIDKEAIRVVKLMPKWKPGTQSGKRVKVYLKLPITFSASEF